MRSKARPRPTATRPRRHRARNDRSGQDSSNRRACKWGHVRATNSHCCPDARACSAGSGGPHCTTARRAAPGGRPRQLAVIRWGRLSAASGSRCCWPASDLRCGAAGGEQHRPDAGLSHAAGLRARRATERPDGAVSDTGDAPEATVRWIRRKSFTLPTSTVDEAALQLDLLDYDSPVHREGHEHRQCPLPCRTDGLPSGTSEPSIGRVAGRRRAARDRQSAASAAAYCWASRRTPRPARPTLPLLPWRRPRPWQSAVSPPRRALRAPHPAS